MSQAPAPAPTSNALALRRPLGQMSPAEIEELAKDPARAAAAITALIRANTAELPETAFVRRGADMTLMKVVKRTALTESRKEIVVFSVNRGKKVGGEWVDNWQKACEITLPGYYALNATIGLNVITPPTVVVDGQAQPNPYVKCNAQYGKPEVIYCRKVVVGPARDTGSLVATDVMLRFDLSLYLMENILAKLDKLQGAAKEGLGVWGLAEDRPREGKWKFYSVEGDVGLWVNIASPVYHLALKDHQGRLKFAERIAQSVATRNALKSHPGMPASVELSGPGFATVAVAGWTSNFNHDQLANLRKAVENGTLGEYADVKRVNVERVGAGDVAGAEEEIGGEAAADSAEEADAKGEGAPGLPEEATDVEHTVLTPTEQGKQVTPTEQNEVKGPAAEAAPQGASAATAAAPTPAHPEAPADRATLLANATRSFDAIREAIGLRKARAEIKQKFGIEDIATASDEQLAKLALETPY